MFHTHTTPTHAFNYADVVKHVRNQERVHILGEDGREEAVLIGAEQYKKIQEMLWERYVDEKLEG